MRPSGRIVFLPVHLPDTLGCQRFRHNQWSWLHCVLEPLTGDIRRTVCSACSGAMQSSGTISPMVSPLAREVLGGINQGGVPRRNGSCMKLRHRSQMEFDQHLACRKAGIASRSHKSV